MSEESVKRPATSKFWAKFDDHYFKQDAVTFTYIYIVYEVDMWPYIQGADIKLGNYLFSAVKLTKNTDFDKYSYSEYGIWFGGGGSEFDKNEYYLVQIWAQLGILIIQRKISWFLVKNNRLFKWY